MVAMAKEAGIAERIEIISNGQLLTREMADNLIAAGLDTLRISLQGLSSEKYRSVGGVDLDYDKFVENIRYFYSHKRETQLFVKVMDVSLDGILNGEVQPGEVVVIRYEGPSGGPGMQEGHGCLPGWRR